MSVLPPSMHTAPLQTENALYTKQSCAYVLHGLNTNPTRMEDLAELLRKKNFQTTLGTLSGHSKTASQNEIISAARWQSEFIEQWTKATTPCQSKQDQRLFVGYSLGALTAMNIFDSQTSIPFPTNLILLSPALSFRPVVALIRGIAWLPFGSLPSLNHPDYRARNMTPLKSYSALFKLHAGWRNFAWSRTASIPTLVVLSENDELVDSQGIAKELAERKLEHWKILWLHNDDAPLRPRYHHLMIDQKSMGARAWKMLEESLANALNQSAQESFKNAN